MKMLRSLSIRLLVLTVVVVLLTEALVFLPGLAQARRTWLWEQLRDADLAAVAMSAAPDGVIPPQTRDELLSLSHAQIIRLNPPDGPVLAQPNTNQTRPRLQIDLRSETALQSLGRALVLLFQPGNPRLLIIGASPRHPQNMIEVVVAGHLLADALRAFARANVMEGLLIAGVTGALLYAAELILLVRPLRRMTGSMAAFRTAPERAPTQSQPITNRYNERTGDEIAIAARELTAMQAELRTALWRNARLAALGTALAKVTHDLRGILSSAMLAADRLGSHSDPNVQRLGNVVVGAVERASELLSQTLAFVREGPPPLTFTRARFCDLVAEAAESVPGLAVRAQIAPELEADLDRMAVFRVLANLLRNAQQAGATEVTVSAGPGGDGLIILVADDGPGLPEAARATLFRAFSGSSQASGNGLGLAIARDLMRAHGGDIVLESTDSSGTTFRLMLPLHESVDA